jgi:PKD repeat protein
LKLNLLILLFAFKLTDIWGLSAGFNLSKTTGCAPLVINFTDNSVASGGFYITSWAYDFGDGGTSTTQNPRYTYTKGGTFKIKLTVTDNASNSNTFTFTIVVLKNPTPDFTIAKSGYCPGEQILFSNKTIQGDTDIKAATWDFGDGNVLAAKGDVTKSYVLAGFYTVKLTVRDYYGCVGIATKPQFVPIDAGPKADFDFSSKYACIAPLKINFTNKSSANSNTFLWDLGNGNTSTDPNPSDMYSSSGTYKVSLVASTKNGCKSSKTINVPVIFSPLKSDFTLVKP